MKREQARDEIKRHISCTDYLEKSKNNMYCCPLCDSGHGQNGTGAVKYYQDTNTWHCHACDRGGDVLDAYQAATGSDYNTALTTLAAQVGITIDSRPTAAQDFSDDATERPQSDENAQKDKYPNDSEKTPQNGTQSLDFTSYYNECSSRDISPTITYWQGRGITNAAAIADYFNFGYDPAGDPANAPGATADEYKPHPAPRIIAPCTKDFYIARSIDPNTPPAFKAPNPKGSHTQLWNAAALYSGTPFYEADVVFIVEGIADALSFIEAGHAAVALNGKGNGKLLLQQLRAKPTTAALVIVPDNEADPTAAAKTMQQAEKLNADLQAMNVKSIVYNVAGDQHDANDALQVDRADFEAAIAAARKELTADDITRFIDKVTTEAYKPYQTGLNFFDNLLSGGIIQQSLLLLMAAPGAGKTTLAQQLAETIAAQGKPVVYFNFEMSREQMLAKAISAKHYRSGRGEKTAMQILQGYNWTAEEREQIEQTIDEYHRQQYPFIRYNPANTSSELTDLLAYLTAQGEAAKARNEAAPAVVVDYLHLIKSSNGLDVQELIKQAVTGLKGYAKDYNTFVIGIVATNRASNKGGKLTMESGRDSSNIEYTADYQISLNYLAIDDGTVKTDDLEKIAALQQQTRRAMILRVLKSRFSQPGKSEKVLFDAAHNTFYGACDDFIPPAGFILDSGAPAF